MQKTKIIRLSKSGIEYLDYMWGVFSGCRNHEVGKCPLKMCWANGLATRFQKIYPNGFEPTFYPESLGSPMFLKKPSRIAVGWVGDVIGYGLEYKKQIFQTIEATPQHTYLFLTKNPENLIRWSPFPLNCQVGVSSDGSFDMTARAFGNLWGIYAYVKFISFEPLLHKNEVEKLSRHLEEYINWIIIGQQTPVRKSTMPKVEWIQEIVEAADKANIPVFLKDNLNKLFAANNCEYYHQYRDTLFRFKDFLSGDSTAWHLRQEFPH